MSAPATPPVFHLTVAHILEIHAEVIGEYGGSTEIRQMSLLESAVAAPRASFKGIPAYADLVEIAAAYQYFLCRNQPLVHGNVQTALGASIVFLRMNGISPGRDSQSWENLMIDVAAQRLDRNQTTRRLLELMEPLVA